MASRPIQGPSRLARPQTSFPFSAAPRQDATRLDKIQQDAYKIDQAGLTVSSNGNMFLEGPAVSPQPSRGTFTQTPVILYSQTSPGTVAPYLGQRHTEGLDGSLGRSTSNGTFSPAVVRSTQVERPVTSVVRSSRDLGIPRTPYAQRLATRAVSSRGRGVSPVRQSNLGSKPGFVSRLHEHGRRG